MKVRTITCFIRLTQPAVENKTAVDVIRRSCDFLARAQEAIEASGIEVQTRRLATNPFPEYLPLNDRVASEDAWSNALCETAVELEKMASSMGVAYVSMGPARVGEWQAYTAIPAALKTTQNVFFSGMMTTPLHTTNMREGDISLKAIKTCAQVIYKAASITPDGFTNLRFAALANVPGGVPFLPAGYHSGENEISFALGLEAADLAVLAAGQSKSLSEMRHNLIQCIENHAQRLSDICNKLARENNVIFAGLDFTLAPFPDRTISIGEALERMGVPAVGLHGTLAGVAFLTDTLDRVQYPRAGFNGVFFPVLEDSVLAQRAQEGSLEIKALLLYSAVCGTGLDTVSLPGDVSIDQLSALLLDLAALAQRLDKPLTARLMPIPWKKADEPTDFDFPFFANSRTIPLHAKPIKGLLGRDESFSLRRRR